jgi:hypothetical protein
VITREEALQLAREYVTEERPWSTMAELLEGDEDYFVREELRPGWQWPLGPGPLFIAKATGEVRVEAFGDVIEKIGRMV